LPNSSCPVSTSTGLRGRSAFHSFIPAFTIFLISLISNAVRCLRSVANARMAPLQRDAGDPFGFAALADDVEC
jgi:hypothetical protein